MRKHYIIIIVLSILLNIKSINAQNINWNSIDSSKHIINASIGLDYSFNFGIGYAYKFDTKLPIIIQTNFAIPSGKSLVDDFKFRVGGQIRLFDKSNFVGAVGINGIYRRYKTHLVRMQNFGADLKGTIGYYRLKWFVAAEIGFDKAIVTHFKHSNSYKENIYADVVDGWYEPSTAGNFNYGLQAGFSLKHIDIIAIGGMLITQDFKTKPRLPFYVGLSCNYKFKQVGKK